MNLLGFDIETSGTSREFDVPVQICLVEHATESNQNRILLNTLANPGRQIPKKASDVHGITDASVRSAPDYVIAAWLCTLIVTASKPAYLVGFNSKSFDEPILSRCIGMPVFPGIQHLDVLDLAYRYFPTEPSHKLSDLYSSFFNETLVDAHDAAADVIATLRLAIAMQKKIGLPFDKLVNEMETPMPYSVCPIGKHKGKLLSEIPVSWAKWMRDNASDMRPDLQATVDAILGAA